MTYVREVTILTIITLGYIGLFLSVIRIGLHGVVDLVVEFESMRPGFETWVLHDFFFFFFFFFCFFYLFIFYAIFVIIITVQICKFNITVSTQFLLLYYSLWCPGLQRLQRFDYHMLMWLSNPSWKSFSHSNREDLIRL